MNFRALKAASDEALNEISKYVKKNGSNNVLQSIENQMKFISSEAGSGVNPKEKLSEGRQFTYGILSSREFSSPEELIIKEKLDNVTEQLNRL
ncbi:immunity protein Tsi6 family protein [Microbulbifer pacificus]|uniref:immunity protein Tsi6 family protein n=1 Tax=Microbulbifer pacificus TaxID=407164 RepID=UPI000CF56FA1|nr:immunity protein Tsi6 family protein [Microbulbifer pacificus]